jgi:hypothetical protein
MTGAALGRKRFLVRAAVMFHFPILHLRDVVLMKRRNGVVQRAGGGERVKIHVFFQHIPDRKTRIDILIHFHAFKILTNPFT